MKKPFSETKVGQFVDKIKPLVGNGLDFVGELTGNKAIEKIGEFLQDKKEQSPEMMAAHMEFEKYKLEWELELQRLDVESFKLEIQDRDSAREMRNEFTRQGKTDWVLGGLVIFTMTLLALMIAILTFVKIPEENRNVFFTLLGGTVVAGSQSIYGYFFGSSSGAKRNADSVRKIAESK